MDAVIAIVLAGLLAVVVCLGAAWVFTLTPLGWTFGQYFALAIGISLASKV